MTSYSEAMRALDDAAYAAVRAANNEDGAPVEALLELAAEIDCLIDHGMSRAEMADARRLYEGAKIARVQMQARIDELEVERDRLREALERIYLWSEAYPTEVFPEPDFKRAAALLSAGGMSIDVVSASNMRHATKGVGKIALAALSKKDT